MRLNQINRFISSLAFPLVAFPVIGWFQIQLGHEFALFPLYMVPVGKLAWEFGWKGAIAGVGMGVVFWLYASYGSEQPFSNEWARYFNASTRGIVFATVAGFVLAFKRVVEQHRSRMEAMRSLLNVCHGCGAVQGSDGQWIPLDELGSRRTSQSSECPKCASTQTHTGL